MSLLFKLTSSLFKKNKTAKICFIGLDSAGKSSIIKKIVENEFNEKLDKRTLGMSVEKISVNGLNFITWDLGGQKAFRDTLWSTYMKGTQGLVYVIDSSNKFRLAESKRELYKFIFGNPYLEHVPILILANKQDMLNAISAEDISNFLNIKTLNKKRVKVVPISCKSGLNIEKAMEWLAHQVIEMNYKINTFQHPIVQTINV